MLEEPTPTDISFVYPARAEETSVHMGIDWICIFRVSTDRCIDFESVADVVLVANIDISLWLVSCGTAWASFEMYMKPSVSDVIRVSGTLFDIRVQTLQVRESTSMSANE